MPDVEDLLRIVTPSLEELRQLDPKGARVFGAKRHRYVLHPPLEEEAVLRFERKHSIALPADYRAFVIELGNGGAGPYHGVFKLGEMDHNAGFKPWKLGESVGVPAKPFPHDEAWNLPQTDLERLQASEDDDETLLIYWVAINGAIPLCHEGCALRDWLAVSGPEAGHVWHDATADFEGWSPCTLPGRRRVTFADWYLAWLDKALQAARTKQL